MKRIYFDGNDFFVSSDGATFKLDTTPDKRTVLKGDFMIDVGSVSKLLAHFNKDVCVFSMMIDTPAKIIEMIHVNNINSQFISGVSQLKTEFKILKDKVEKHNKSGMFGRMKKIDY